MHLFPSRSAFRPFALLLVILLLATLAPAHLAARPQATLDAATRHALAHGQMLPAAGAPQPPQPDEGQASLQHDIPLLPQGGQPAAAAVLPGAGTLAFSSDSAGSHDIYLRPFPSESNIPFISGPGDIVTPVWSPDGRQLVYVSTVDGDFEIYLRTDSGATRQLTVNTATDFHPSWSPDGQRILFASNRGGLYQIFTMDLYGQNVQQIGVVPGNNALYPRYAPDGGRISYMRASVAVPACDWNWDVWVMNADGSGQRRVTSQLFGDLYPNWTPDGSRIIYGRCEYALTSDLYLIDPDTGQEQQVTDQFLSNEWNGVYSADGNYLAFNSSVNGSADIFVGATTDTIAHNITPHPAEDTAPNWQGTATGLSCAGADMANQPLLLAPGWGAADTIYEDGSAFAKMLPILEADGYRLGCNLFYAGSTSAEITLYQNGRRIMDTLCAAHPVVDALKANWDGRFDIIGHSFGGLRSRAFLESPDLYDQTGRRGAACTNPPLPPGKKLFVENLFTLGSPHGGGSPLLPGAMAIGLPHILNAAKWGSVIELFTMDSFNSMNEQPDNVCYRLIGGNAWAQTSMHAHWLSQIYIPPLRLIPNDLGVFRSSAHAIAGMDNYPRVVAIDTPDMHGYSFLTNSIDSYVTPATTYNAYIRDYLTGDKKVCVSAGRSVAEIEEIQADSEPVISQIELEAGQLISGTLKTGSFALAESGPTAIFLNWAEGEMALTLADPGGTQLTPDTAAALPGVDYNAGAIMANLAGYTLDNPLTGTWTYTITAGALPRPMPYQLTAVPDLPITLAAEAGDWQPLHTPVSLAATLAYSTTTPLTGATVSAAITRPDGGTDNITLYDDGLHADGAANDGTYGQTYAGATVGGHYLANITATGSYEAQAYTRTAKTFFTVAPATATTGSSFSDTPRATAVPGLFDWLDVGLTIDTTEAGDYAIAADLVTAGGAHVAHALTKAALGAGTHQITLSFYGETIKGAGLDGPYTLTGLQIAELSNGALVLHKADDVYTTAVYQHDDFGDVKTLYLPAILAPR